MRTGKFTYEYSSKCKFKMTDDDLSTDLRYLVTVFLLEELGNIK